MGGKERTGSERDPDEHGHGHGIFSAQLLALISNAQRGEQEKKKARDLELGAETAKGSRVCQCGFRSCLTRFYFLFT